MQMKEIKLKIGGFIFIEKFGDQEEDERIKIFDSDKKYLDYIPVDYIYYSADVGGISLEKQLEYECKSYEDAEDIHKLLELIGIESYPASKDWENLLEDAYGLGYQDDSEEKIEKADAMTKEEFLESEWVNRIGDYYILQTDN